MRLGVMVYEYRDKEDIQKIINYHRFIVSDVLGFADKMNQPVRIVDIYTYSGTDEEKEREISSIVEKYGKDDTYDIPTVITLSTYISTEEFPKEKYYLFDKDKKGGLTPIDVDAVLERESKLVERLGFININDYTQYEYQEAYIYGNDIGKVLRETITKFMVMED